MEDAGILARAALAGEEVREGNVCMVSIPTMAFPFRRVAEEVPAGRSVMGIAAAMARRAPRFAGEIVVLLIFGILLQLLELLFGEHLGDRLAADLASDEVIPAGLVGLGGSLFPVGLGGVLDVLLHGVS